MQRQWDIAGGDLVEWSATHQASGALPSLVRRLLLATAPIQRIDMRADAGVALGGWDGIVAARGRTAFCPAGLSGWELSTTRREDLKKKRATDYDKRTKQPGRLAPDQATYVAVFSTHCPDKDQWIAEKQAQGPWADVRLYDADDLATWLEEAPAVAVWFAGEHLGRPLSGMVSVERFLKRWSRRTRPPLPDDLVRIGRERERRSFEDWLERREAGPLHVRGNTREEVLLFSSSVLAAGDGDRAEHFAARALVLENRDAWRWALAVQPDRDLILLPNLPDIDTGEVAERRVVVPLEGIGQKSVPIHINLPTIPPRPMADRLQEAGFPEEDAQRLAWESSGRLEVVQRACGYTTRPWWADDADVDSLGAMLLAGKWATGNQADRQALSRLGSSAQAIENLCTRLATGADAPLVNDGGVWTWRSRQDAWTALIGRLAGQQLDNLVETACEVLGEDDPQIDFDDPTEGFIASLRGERLRHSPALREGLADSLARLALSDEDLATTQGHNRAGSTRAASAVARILQPDWRRWTSLAHELPHLAEAAPEQFLDALERSQEAAGRTLRERQRFGLIGALAVLGWSNQHLPRVVSLLAGLSAEDADERDPAASLLLQLLHPWYPQSNTTAEERIQLLKNVWARRPGVGRSLSFEIWGSMRPGTGALPSRSPVFRPWMPTDEGGVWAPERDALGQARETLHLLMNDAGANPERWARLVAQAFLALHEPATEILDGLEDARPADLQASVWSALRQARWNLSARAREKTSLSSHVERVHRMYESFTPEDRLLRIVWLFDPAPPLPESWAPLDEWHRRLNERQQEALENLWQDGERWELLEQLTVQVKRPDILGNVLGGMAIADDIEEQLRHSPQSYPGLTAHFFAACIRRKGMPWARVLFEEFLAHDRVDEAADIALAVRDERGALWTLINDLADLRLRDAYWQRVTSLQLMGQIEEPDRMIERLLTADNRQTALSLALVKREELPVETIATILESVRDGLAAGEQFSFEFMGMHASRLFDRLNDDDSLDDRRVLGLELAFMSAGILGYGYDSRRLSAELSSNPAQFVDLLRMAYPAQKADEQAGEVEDRDARMQKAGARLLVQWSGVPGADIDDPDERDTTLRSWCQQVLAAAARDGRARGAAYEVARVLARAWWPGADGYWPGRATRELLQSGAHPELGRFLSSARFNRRGAGVNSASRERRHAASYRAHALTMRLEWPETARVLEALAGIHEGFAEDFERDNRRMGLTPATSELATTGTEAANVSTMSGDADDEVASSWPTAIQRIDALRIEHTGPSARMDMQLASRLNLVTGDNSAGKTFVLDVMWWAITGCWTGYPAWPRADRGSEDPLIALDAQAANPSRFDFGGSDWKTPDNWPLMRSLAIYARVDGGFSIWDPGRPGRLGARSIDLSAQEVLHGKRATNNGIPGDNGTICNGLVADWPFWEARKPAVFERLVRVLHVLSPPDEPMEPGETRPIGNERLEYPHIRLPYGDVPVIHASAAVKRILSLAYLLVWSWYWHRDSTGIGQRTARSMVLLIDEVENHLHPRWQRVFLPALLQVIEPLQADGEPGIDAQIIATTHAPLVTASVEAYFDPRRDALFHFGLERGDVDIERVDWFRRGDVSAWLTDDVFGLEEPRSKEAESAIRRALALYLEEEPEPAEVELVDARLRDVLGDVDPFWVGWRRFSGLSKVPS